MNYTTFEVRVRYSETDQMSFVHHSNYFKYFELARLEWLNFLGISYSQIEESGVLMPVFRASAEYIKPLFFDESFKITISLMNPPKATLKFQYVVFNSKNIIVKELPVNWTHVPESKLNIFIDPWKMIIDIAKFYKKLN